jgi:hypothetical protein
VRSEGTHESQGTPQAQGLSVPTSFAVVKTNGPCLYHVGRAVKPLRRATPRFLPGTGTRSDSNTIESHHCPLRHPGGSGPRDRGGRAPPGRRRACGGRSPGRTTPGAQVGRGRHTRPDTGRGLGTCAEGGPAGARPTIGPTRQPPGLPHHGAVVREVPAKRTGRRPGPTRARVPPAPRRLKRSEAETHWTHDSGTTRHGLPHPPGSPPHCRRPAGATHNPRDTHPRSLDTPDRYPRLPDPPKTPAPPLFEPEPHTTIEMRTPGRSLGRGGHVPPRCAAGQWCRSGSVGNCSSVSACAAGGEVRRLASGAPVCGEGADVLAERTPKGGHPHGVTALRFKLLAYWLYGP